MRAPRSCWLVAASLVAGLSARVAWADEVPPWLQVKLLSKATGYIRNFTLPAGAAKVMVVYPGPTDSPTREAQKMASALAKVDLEGSTVQIALVPFRNVDELRLKVAAEKPSIIYLASDLDEKGITGVVEVCHDSNLLTATGTPRHVRLGVVLGFKLDEGAPKILVNLAQAKKQRIDFSSKLLALAEIVE